MKNRCNFVPDLLPFSKCASKKKMAFRKSPMHGNHCIYAVECVSPRVHTKRKNMKNEKKNMKKRSRKSDAKNIGKSSKKSSKIDAKTMKKQLKNRFKKKVEKVRKKSRFPGKPGGPRAPVRGARGGQQTSTRHIQREKHSTL